MRQKKNTHTSYFYFPVGIKKFNTNSNTCDSKLDSEEKVDEFYANKSQSVVIKLSAYPVRGV